MLPCIFNCNALSNTNNMYTKLSYLQSQGNQWINTGFNIPTNLGMDIKFSYKDNSNCMVVGGGGTAYNNEFSLYVWDKSVQFHAMHQTKFTLPSTSEYNARCYSTNTYSMLFLNDVQQTVQSIPSHGDYNNSNKIMLFGLNRGNPSSFLSYGKNVKIHYCKFMNDITQFMSLIPVLWKQGYEYTDGNTNNTVVAAYAKPGMYDQIGQKLYVNQGTGQFTYGE